MPLPQDLKLFESFYGILLGQRCSNDVVAVDNRLESEACLGAETMLKP
jgi:hypothetical protein